MLQVAETAIQPRDGLNKEVDEVNKQAAFFSDTHTPS